MTAMESDARRPIWGRALEAPRAPEYCYPHQAPRARRTLLILIERHMAGRGLAEVEACVDVEIDATQIRATVASEREHRVTLPSELQDRPMIIAEVADAVVSNLAARKSLPDS